MVDKAVVFSLIRQLFGDSSSGQSGPWPQAAGGHHPESVTSNLGDVVELSGFGARVKCKGKPELEVGQTVRLTLRSPHAAMMLMSEVEKIRRAGSDRFEIALRFLEVKPATQAALNDLARKGVIKRGVPLAENAS